MNAAIAIHGRYAYIGSRTDGTSSERHAGVMVVDISCPARPRLVREMQPPLEANVGESSRELRVWQSQDIPSVLHTNCGGPGAHGCTPHRSTTSVSTTSRAADPRLLYQLNMNAPEFFPWADPRNRDRALMFAGNAGSTCSSGTSPSCPLSVWDISPLRGGKLPMTRYSGIHGYTDFPAAPQPVQKPAGGLHSLSVSNDGTRAYYALVTSGFAVVDVSDFAYGRPLPQPRPVTLNEARPTWPGPGAHGAVKLWNNDWAYVSDEVDGTATARGHGCPWGGPA